MLLEARKTGLPKANTLGKSIGQHSDLALLVEAKTKLELFFIHILDFAPEQHLYLNRFQFEE